MFHLIARALRALTQPHRKPTNRHNLRLAAANAAAREAAAVTGWPLAGLVEQTLEDTCLLHGKFCCAQCFAVRPAPTTTGHSAGARRN
jgi:hypothetical protein